MRDKKDSYGQSCLVAVQFVVRKSEIATFMNSVQEDSALASSSQSVRCFGKRTSDRIGEAWEIEGALPTSHRCPHAESVESQR
jgi:hypothetical protein